MVPEDAVNVTSYDTCRPVVFGAASSVRGSGGPGLSVLILVLAGLEV